ncbi:glycosyltransferase [bacterium]|nr:MAG: glycosyltransferase [bacterium]
MEWVDVIRDYYFIIALSYVGLILFLTIGVALNKIRKKGIYDTLPKVSVVVSARNEEVDIADCLESLIALEYPKDKLQLILVNDRSTDRTAEIIQEYQQKSDLIEFYDTKDYETHLEAKARGISYGMKHATGDWVFITDADARVKPRWILEQINQVDDEKIGMLGGPLVVEANSLLSSVERASWAWTQLFNLGMAGYNQPFICVGPNMAIKKEIYDSYGGLENFPFTVAEDLALFNMVIKSGHTTKTVVSKDAIVTLAAVPSFTHLFSQQHRWFRGGLEGGVDYKLILPLAFSWGYIVFSYIWLGWFFSLEQFGIFWALYLGINYSAFFVQAKKLNIKRHLRYALVISLYLPLFSVFVLPSFFFKKNIEWAGLNYKIVFEKKNK